MNIAIVLAGGVGKRMSNDMPKQFLFVDNKPILYYSLNTFANHKLIDQIYVVSHKDYVNDVQDILAKYGIQKVQAIIEGGETRQQSVFNALSSIKASKTDIVLIHDSARPLVDNSIIENNIKECEKHDAVETAIQVVDTVLMSEDHETYSSTLNRNNLYQVQTPQTFKYGLIKTAHEKAIKVGELNVSDDAQLAVKNGHKVYIVPGSRENFKVTTSEDLELLKSILLKKKA